MKGFETVQHNLINAYIDATVDNALEAITMIDGEYVKDVCMANIQDDIDFSDIEEQIKHKCDVVIRKEMEKLLANLAL